MFYKNLVIINNEKVFKENNSFYCDNLNLKIIPEELNEYHEVQYIARRSNKKEENHAKTSIVGVSRCVGSPFILYILFRALEKEAPLILIYI